MEKCVGIIGGAESGVGAALLASKHNWTVLVSDFGAIKENYKTELIANGIAFEEGGHSENRLLKMDMIVKSPGVPGNVPIMKLLRKNGVPIVSEIDFASRYFGGEIIAITGSNGKTTTTSIVHHLLKTAGLNAILAGNIGTSFSRALLDAKEKIAVIEVSSFQLDDLLAFKPKVAVITNITPDHLDRYGYDFSAYANAKFKISQFQGAGDVLIYNGSDGKSVSLIGDVNDDVKLLSVSTSDLSEILEKEDGNQCSLKLLGNHNRFNAAMAIFAARQMGLGHNDIVEGLESFESIEHRLEVVAEIDGVKFINDSKATNVDSVLYALDGMTSPVLWIVGGVDKGNDYGVIKKLVEEKVKEIIILSSHPEKVYAAFDDMGITISQFENTKEAVEYAKNHSEKGDVVLLSPACASFDLFDNYEHRGFVFKEEVLKLK